jgi:hypothetical protein
MANRLNAPVCGKPGSTGDAAKFGYAILTQGNPMNFWTRPDGSRMELLEDWFTVLDQAGSEGWEVLMPLPTKDTRLDWSTKTTWVTLLLKPAVP